MHVLVIATVYTYTLSSRRVRTLVGWAISRMGWANFQERGFSKIRPPPSLCSHLSSSPMGVFSRAYGMFIKE